jgi:hypothetical protein
MAPVGEDFRRDGACSVSSHGRRRGKPRLYESTRSSVANQSGYVRRPGKSCKMGKSGVDSVILAARHGHPPPLACVSVRLCNNLFW